VRHEDPIPPLLYDFAAILVRANAASHIRGVVLHLIPGSVTHLQYAGDMILMLQLDEVSITNLKFILICF
jgi:hypothetical protein